MANTKGLKPDCSRKQRSACAPTVTATGEAGTMPPSTAAAMPSATGTNAAVSGASGSASERPRTVCCVYLCQGDRKRRQLRARLGTAERRALSSVNSCRTYPGTCFKKPQGAASLKWVRSHLESRASTCMAPCADKLLKKKGAGTAVKCGARFSERGRSVHGAACAGLRICARGVEGTPPASRAAGSVLRGEGHDTMY